MVQRTTAHFPHPPQCTLLIKDKVSNNKGSELCGSQFHSSCRLHKHKHKANYFTVKSADQLLIFVLALKEKACLTSHSRGTATLERKHWSHLRKWCVFIIAICLIYLFCFLRTQAWQPSMYLIPSLERRVTSPHPLYLTQYFSHSCCLSWTRIMLRSYFLLMTSTRSVANRKPPHPPDQHSTDTDMHVVSKPFFFL